MLLFFCQLSEVSLAKICITLNLFTHARAHTLNHAHARPQDGRLLHLLVVMMAAATSHRQGRRRRRGGGRRIRIVL